MKDKDNKEAFGNLPDCAADYIRLVIKKMRWQRKACADVQAELIGHFEDALKDCKTDEEREKTAKKLIDNFGDAKLIAVLARRAKKRCRPLWQKILIHSFQALVIVSIYLSICGVYISSGKPNISVNYVEWLNTYVRQGRDESLNIAPLLKKAAELSIDEPNWLKKSNASWPGDFNETQLHEFENWLAQNKQVLETLRKALDKPYYWNIYDANKSDFTNMQVLASPMKELSNFRRLAKLVNWQIRYSAFKNNFEEATNKAIELCDLGQRMQGNGMLVEQLVGIAIESTGHSAISQMIDKTTPTTEQLERTQNFLQQNYNDTVIDISGERALVYDYIQRYFTDDGKGGGKPVRQGTGFAGKNTLQIIFNILTFNLPDKKEIIEQIDNIYDTCQQGFQTANLETMKEQLNKALYNSPMLMKIELPAFEKVGELSWRVKTQRDGLITTLAILRYRQQTGKYPDSLDELLNKGFINKMPYDVYRNGPLTYRKTDNNFILYSLGEDLVDNGGKVIYNDKGQPRIWPQKDGDAVFWPVPHPVK